MTKSRIVKAAALTLVLSAGSFQVGAENVEAKKGDAYPLATCPVSGGTLGSMGKPVIYVHQGREVRFCCKGCVEPFQKKATEYLKKVDAAIVKQQLGFYPPSTCVVSGKSSKRIDHGGSGQKQ